MIGPSPPPAFRKSPMRREFTPSARAWGTVALLWFVGLLNYLDRVTITTMHGSLTAAVPMTEAQFGLLTTVFLVVYGGLSPFAGYLADRFSRARVIVVSLFVWSFITWLTSHAKTFEQLLATRALMGISEACYIPAALAMIADFHRGPTRSLATGINSPVFWWVPAWAGSEAGWRKDMVGRILFLYSAWWVSATPSSWHFCCRTHDPNQTKEPRSLVLPPARCVLRKLA